MTARLGAASCTNVNRPRKMRESLQQALDAEKALLDAFGVVQTVDTDADQGVGTEMEFVDDAGAALARRSAPS